MRQAFEIGGQIDDGDVAAVIAVVAGNAVVDKCAAAGAGDGAPRARRRSAVG